MELVQSFIEKHNTKQPVFLSSIKQKDNYQDWRLFSRKYVLLSWFSQLKMTGNSSTDSYSKDEFRTSLLIILTTAHQILMIISYLSLILSVPIRAGREKNRNFFRHQKSKKPRKFLFLILVLSVFNFFSYFWSSFQSASPNCIFY